MTQDARIRESATRHRTVPVIFLHGLFMTGLDSALLRQRLGRAGFAPELFRYHSTRATIEEITGALAASIRGAGPLVHVVGHSLGGVIALETFDRHPDLPPGRVVLLGSPVRGSRAASAIASWSIGPQLLGPLVLSEIARSRDCRWNKPRELGVIAGARSVGFGRVFADLPHPNDGTVAVDETRIAGARDQTVMNVSHIGMLFSTQVADAVWQFLVSGSFATGVASFRS